MGEMQTEEQMPVASDNVAEDQESLQTDDARGKLLEEATGTAGSDRVAPVGTAEDRASFRQICEEARQDMRGGLQEAGQHMTAINEAVEAGQMEAGSAEHQQALVQASESYKAATSNADQLLYEHNADGSVKINQETGLPVESTFSRRVGQERETLRGEIDLLTQAQDEGRALTKQEMQQLGLQSPDAAAALKEFTQQDMMLEDVQRSAAYARANYGMAMFRACAGVDGATRGGLVLHGQLALQEASMLDEKMMGPPPDPNFKKNFQTVVTKAFGDEAITAANGEGQEQTAAQSGAGELAEQGRAQGADQRATAYPGRGAEQEQLPEQGYAPGQAQEQAQNQPRNQDYDQSQANRTSGEQTATGTPPRDSGNSAGTGSPQSGRPESGMSRSGMPAPGSPEAGTAGDTDFSVPQAQAGDNQTGSSAGSREMLQIPTGDANPGDANFENPYAILNEVRRDGIQSPMSTENVNGYLTAIKAADSIDRNFLQNQMTADSQYMEKVLNSDVGERIRPTLQVIDQANADMDKQQVVMSSMIPGLTAENAGGQQAREMLSTMQQFKDPNQLAAYLNHPENKQSVQKFQQLPNGAEFLSTLQQFSNNNQIVKEGEDEIAALDPQFSEARRNLEKNQELYKSSEDIRAQLVKQLISDGKNQQVPGYAELAQDTTMEIAQLNPRLIEDQEFMTVAQGLGLKASESGVLECIAQPGAPGSVSSLDLSNPPIAQALAAYEQVNANIKAGKPGLDANTNAVFQKAISDAANITPEQITAERQRNAEQLKAAGWGQGDHAAREQAVQAALSAVPADKQQQVQAIQQQIDQLAGVSDQTAQQQRMKLETELNGLGGQDKNVKKWLDARVAMAELYRDNPALVEARTAYEQNEMVLDAVEHGKPIAEGLYGAALLASGDKENSRQFLVNAAGDPAALELAPEIAQAIQQHGDQSIMTEAASRVADTSSAGRSVSESDTAGNGALMSQQMQQQYMQAGQALGTVSQLVDTLEQGKPLSSEHEQLFQQAIALNKQLDPQALEQIKEATRQQLLPDGQWDEQKEQQWQAINKAVMQAEAGISPQSAQALQSVAASLDPNNPASQQQYNAKMQELAASDPSVKPLVEAMSAHEQFYSRAGQIAANRDAFEQASAEVLQLQHGKGIAETAYASALIRTGDKEQILKAQELMKSATTDKGLLEVLPQAADVALSVGAPVELPPTENDKIPGFKKLNQAQGIMLDQTLSPEQRIEKAGPLYAQAIEESKQIDTKKLANESDKIQSQLQQIEVELGASGDNPQKMQQLQSQAAKLSADAASMQSMLELPMQAHFLSAMAHNQAADEIYGQANGDENLVRTADGYNDKAVQTLQSFEKEYPELWQMNPALAGAVKQAQDHKLIDPESGSVVGQTMMLDQMNRTALFGPGMGRERDITMSENASAGGQAANVGGQVALRGAVQPLWMGMNIAGDALGAAGKVPVVGFIPGAMGAGLSKTDAQRPQMAQALAEAKATNETAANATVSDMKQDLKNSASYMASDIASGYAGLAAGRAVSSLVGGKLKPVAFLASGLTTAAGVNKTLDVAADKAFGVDQRDNAELLSRSAASFGMTWGLRGLNNYKAGNNANFLNQSGERLSMADSFKVWNKDIVPTVQTNTFKMNGTNAEVSNRFRNTFANLTPEQKGMVGPQLADNVTGSKFASMNHNQQYNALTKAIGQAEGAGAGNRLKSINPFSHSTKTPMDRVNPETHWSTNRAKTWAYDATGGAGAMGIYGVGEVNPFLKNDATGQNYSLKDTLVHAGSNAAYGGAAGLAAPAVGKAGDFLVKKPLQWGLGTPAKWLFSEGGEMAGRNMRMTPNWFKSDSTGFMALTGDATVKRAVTGAGVGGATGTVLNSPWLNENNTWGDAAKSGAMWGTASAAGLASLPWAGNVLKNSGKEVYNRAGAPIIDNVLTRPMAPVAEGTSAWSAVPKRMIPGAAVGGTYGFFEDAPFSKNPETGRNYTVMESLTNAAKYAGIGAAVTGTSPFTQKWVSAVGRQAADNTAVQTTRNVVGNGVRDYVRTYAAPTSLLISDAAANAYGVREWNRIDAEANAILQAAREESEKKKSGSRQGGR